ncbi:MAG: hypothetical protein NW701_16340 [Nitrospira sp.]
MLSRLLNCLESVSWFLLENSIIIDASVKPISVMRSSDLERYQEILARQDWGIFALFDAFVADEFIKPAMTQTDYKVTSAVADVLFNSGMLPARIDGIVYPSVAFRHGTNFAVRAEAFKSKMRAVPAETQVIEITDVFGYGIFDWQVLATLKSINPDGSLNWEPSS